MPPGNPEGYKQGLGVAPLGHLDDAPTDDIAEVLMKYYGITPDLVPGMKEAVTNKTSPYADAVAQRALELRAQKEQRRLEEMAYLAHLITNRDNPKALGPGATADLKLQDDYHKKQVQSEALERQAMKKEEAEGIIADTDKIMGNINTFLQDVKPLPGGGTSSGFRHSSNFDAIEPVPYGGRDITVPAPSSPAPTPAPNKEDLYRQRLRRAIQVRRAMLGM